MHSGMPKGESRGAPARRQRAAWITGSITLAASLLGANPAAAEEQGAEQVRAATADPSLLTVSRPQGSPPWDRSSFLAPAHFELHGGLQNDVGFAKYTFDNPNSTDHRKEDFYDFRGRFVLEPSLSYDFGRDYFVRVWAQYVLWMREQLPTYQGNADDIVVQIGQKDVWDFMVGRFLTWRVYRKGLGFDLYTLDDLGGSSVVPGSGGGALVVGPAEPGSFGPHIYEVDELFMRGTPGRAAFHLYPTSWSGLEVAAEYGKLPNRNTLGTRAAGNITYGPVSVSAAAEYRHSSPSQEVKDPITMIVCDKCAQENRNGYGGGAVLHLSPVELGANAAIAHVTVRDGASPGAELAASAVKTTSLGGYAELDVGSLLLHRKLVAGAGLNRTEALAGDNAFKRHVQAAAYLFFPLGFNDASLKLVLSRADLQIDAPPGSIVAEDKTHMYEGRVRFVFKF